MTVATRKILPGLLLILAFFSLAALLVLLETPTGSVKGVILDEKGQALAGARIILDAYPVNWKTYTDEKGRFQISQVPVRKYYANVYKKGFKRAYLKQQTIVEGQVTDLGTTKLQPVPPRLYVSLWDNTKMPGEKVALSISGAKIQNIQFKAYSVNLIQLLQSGTRLNQIERRDARPEYFPALKLVEEWEYTVPEKERVEFDLKVPLKESKHPWSEKEGLYLIHATGASLDRSKVFSSNTLFNRTNLGFLVKGDASRYLVYASTLKDAQPVAGVQVRLFNNTQSSESLETNEQGLAIFDLTEHKISNKQPPFTVATLGKSVAYTFAPDEGFFEEPGEGFEGNGGDSGKRVFTFIYTDRPLYRPAQRVFFKGISRDRNPRGTYNLPGEDTTDLVVEDPRGNIIAELNPIVGEDGSFSGSFLLGEDADLGYYTLRASLFGRDYTKNIEVDEYRKPEFKIETTPGREFYFGGDEITYLIDVQYFFGAPVEAEIQWTLYKSAYFYIPPGEGLLPDYWDYFGEEEYVGGYGEYLKDGKVKTDAQGHAQVSFKTEKSDQDHRYTLRMQAKDISDRQIEREASIVVTAGDFFFRTERREFLAFPEKPFSLTVLTRNYKDEPVPISYKIEVLRQHWDPIAKNYEYKKVAKVKGKTDEKGRATSEIVVPKGGYYHLVLKGKDSEGRKVSFTDYLWVSGSGKDSEDFGIAKEVKIIPEKKAFSAGDVAKLFIVGPQRNGKVLLTIEGQGIYQEQIVQLDGFSKEIEVTLKKEWIPNVYISASAIGNREFYTGETQLAVSPEAYYLKVGIKTDQEKYEPGDSISYQISTQDFQGNPVAADFSLGVVDEKIYALKADSTNIKKFFWGPRPNRVGTNYSFSGYYSGGIQKEDRNLLRRNFKDTAYWKAHLRTDESGQASVQFKLPDNLTTWRATVVATTLATAVGQETQKVISTKPLIARIAAPRFFTEKDVVYLKAILHNYTEKDQTLTVSLGLEGLAFVNPKDDEARTVTLKTKEVISFDYPVLAKTPGEAKIQLLAKNDQVSDGVELAIPIIPYGIADHQYAQGEIPGAMGDSPRSAKVDLVVPPKSNASRSSLEVILDTSFVAQLIGSLNYLVQYPYGCVEQTMSRLLPALMVAQVAKDLGITDPLLEKKLPRVIKKGLKRIYRMQNYQGGWGWWKNDETDAFMTAYALYGIINAAQMGQKVEANVLRDGRKALKKILQEKTTQSHSYLFGPDGTQYFIHYVASLANIRSNPPIPRGKALTNPIAQSLLALTLIQNGQLEDAKAFLAQIEREAICENGQCHLQQKNKYWDYSTLATAWALQALIKGNVENSFLKDGMARWLLAQRKGGRWRQTLETAVVLYSLVDYSKKLPGSQEGVQAGLFLNGQNLEKINIGSPHFVRRLQGCEASDPKCTGKKMLPLRSGNNDLKISNPQPHNLYYQTEFIAFSTEENIAPNDQGIRITREYFRLKSIRGNNGQDRQFKAEAIKGDIQKGETIGVRLTLETSQDLSYLMIEDPLPSGFEVIDGIRFDPKTAHVTDQSVRDEKITFFRSRLKAGKHVFNYGLLPELAGDFYVLPTQSSEMYRPEIRGSGASAKLKVTR